MTSMYGTYVEVRTLAGRRARVPVAPAAEPGAAAPEAAAPAQPAATVGDLKAAAARLLQAAAGGKLFFRRKLLLTDSLALGSLGLRTLKPDEFMLYVEPAAQKVAHRPPPPPPARPAAPRDAAAAAGADVLAAIGRDRAAAPRPPTLRALVDDAAELLTSAGAGSGPARGDGGGGAACGPEGAPAPLPLHLRPLPPAVEAFASCFERLLAAWRFARTARHLPRPTWRDLRPIVCDLEARAAAGETRAPAGEAAGPSRAPSAHTLELMAALCPEALLVRRVERAAEPGDAFRGQSSFREAPSLEPRTEAEPEADLMGDEDLAIDLPYHSRAGGTAAGAGPSADVLEADMGLAEWADRRAALFRRGLHTAVDAAIATAADAAWDRLTPAGLPRPLARGRGADAGAAPTPALPSAAGARPRRRAEPCRGSEPLTAEHLLEHLRAGLGAGPGRIIAHVEELPSRPARYGPLEPPLPPALATALRARGVDPGRLYAHQAAAVAAARAAAASADASGGSLVRALAVATPTASGKSLCFNLPVLETLLSKPHATALYLYPTKALAQDQLRALRALAADAGLPPDAFAVYDGDTPAADRPRILATCRVLLTNPDMLHVTVLPQHRSLARILANLSFVVVDEAHAYYSVFGSHTALVLRRLRRIAEVIYAAQPVCILCSATIANPGAHAANLTGFCGEGQVAVIDADGAPAGRKLVVMWNPPVRAGVAGRGIAPAQEKPAAGAAAAGGKRAAPDQRRKRARLVPAEPRGKAAIAAALLGHAAASPSPAADAPPPPLVARLSPAASALAESREPPERTSSILELAFLLAECVQHGVRVLAFCKTRKLSELVLTYACELVSRADPKLASKLRSYRGGHAPADRRATEAALFSGSLLGVAATNALELGVDVGSLDATLHLGFPGSVSSFWQQAGRAGRREQTSLCLYVAFGGPLDQYFVAHPLRLLRRPVEPAHVDARNPNVLAMHLACAAAELPLRPARDAAFFGPASVGAAEALRARGVLGPEPDWPRGAHEPAPLRYCGEADAPAREVSLRTVDRHRYVVLDSATREVLEEIEESKAFYEVYEGAVYMNQGRTFLCTALDLGARVATVKAARLPYFTRMIDVTRIEVTGGAGAYAATLPPPEADAAAGGFNDGAGHSAAGDPAGARCTPAVVRVTFRGFQRLRHGSFEALEDLNPLVLPNIEYETEAAWIRVPESARAAVRAQLGEEEGGGSIHDATHAAAHAVLAVLPAFVSCSPADANTGCDVAQESQHVYHPLRLLLYDTHPGGLGIARQAAPQIGQLLAAALELLEACECEGGCHGCILQASCLAYNVGLSKKGAVIVLRELLGLPLAGLGAAN